MKQPQRDWHEDSEDAVRRLLLGVGEDPDRQGLAQTPARVVRSLDFLTEGYAGDPVATLREAVFNDEADQMIVVKDLEFYSLCEHHLLPFYGRAHVAYLPDGKIVGLSKIGRVLDILARRLQVQERLTSQVAEAVDEAVSPKGVGVVMEAYHLCMMMRGCRSRAARP